MLCKQSLEEECILILDKLHTHKWHDRQKILSFVSRAEVILLLKVKKKNSQCLVDFCYFYGTFYMKLIRMSLQTLTDSLAPWLKEEFGFCLYSVLKKTGPLCWSSG